jgi:arginase family enzyme
MICDFIIVGLLCSMDLVEVNPILGNESDVGDTIDLATGLICSGLGSVIL